MAIRPLQLNMRLNEEELDRLEAVAEHHGLDRIPLIRYLIKREYDRLCLDQVKKHAQDAKEKEQGEAPREKPRGDQEAQGR